MTTSTLVKTLGLVLSLGFDTFAVAVGLGISGLSRGDRYRYGIAFAFAEGIMPLAGFLVGQVVASAIGDFASYGAIVLLLGVGVYGIWEATHEEEREYTAATPFSLVILALSVSLDELAIGFSLGLLHIPIVLTVVLIALQAFLLTLIGSSLGDFIGERIASRAGILSGIVLTLLALFLMGEKLFSA